MSDGKVCDDNHNVLRGQINSILALSNHSQKEKDMLIFQLMNRNRRDAQPPPRPLTDCPHYERGCVVVAPCCQRLYPCRLCHDAAESDHNIDRFSIFEVVCKECDTRQSCSNECVLCHTPFAKYYCDVCHLWLNSETNPTYHCNDCGICRKGAREDFFHCGVCGMCLSVEMRGTHRCVENTGNSDCPCCGDDLFTSTEDVSVLKCGHTIHRQCLAEYTMYNTNCPLCKKSIGDMTRQWEIMSAYIETISTPSEYADKTTEILCNDCETRSTVPFNMVAHRCPGCNGYNTSPL